MLRHLGLLEAERAAALTCSDFADVAAYRLRTASAWETTLLSAEDWQVFGLARDDAPEEIKRLSLQGLLIVQAASDVVRISWKHHMEARAYDVPRSKLTLMNCGAHSGMGAPGHASFEPIYYLVFDPKLIRGRCQTPA